MSHHAVKIRESQVDENGLHVDVRNVRKYGELMSGDDVDGDDAGGGGVRNVKNESDVYVNDDYVH